MQKAQSIFFITVAISAFKYWDVNIVYGWAVSQKLPVNDFKWVEKTCQFNEDFTKNYNEDSNTDIILT